MSNLVAQSFKTHGYAQGSTPTEGLDVSHWIKRIAVGARSQDQIEIDARLFEIVRAPGDSFSMDVIEFEIRIVTRSGFSQNTKFVVPADSITERYLAGVTENVHALFGFAKTLTV